MTTDKAFEQLKLAALEVKAMLIDIDENIHPSVTEVEKLSEKVNKLGEELVIYKFLKTQKELSPSFNIHLKVMEKVTANEEKVPITNDVAMPETNGQLQAPIETTVKTVKKMELGLNDKFRIINELFNQNTTEYNLAMDQLNLIESLASSEAYLNELKKLYNWKNDHELTLRLFQLNQKRFV